MEEIFVSDRTDTINNFRTLISYRKSNNHELNKYYYDWLKAGKVFVIEIIDGVLEFAPSKFVGYKNNTKEIHEKLHNNGRDGRNTDSMMLQFYRMVDKDEDLNQLLNYFF